MCLGGRWSGACTNHPTHRFATRGDGKCLAWACSFAWNPSPCVCKPFPTVAVAHLSPPLTPPPSFLRIASPFRWKGTGIDRNRRFLFLHGHRTGSPPRAPSRLPEPRTTSAPTADRVSQRTDLSPPHLSSHFLPLFPFFLPSKEGVLRRSLSGFLDLGRPLEHVPHHNLVGLSTRPRTCACATSKRNLRVCDEGKTK